MLVPFSRDETNSRVRPTAHPDSLKISYLGDLRLSGEIFEMFRPRNLVNTGRFLNEATCHSGSLNGFAPKLGKYGDVGLGSARLSRLPLVSDH